MPNIFSLTTNNITIAVQPEYVENESSPIDSRYVWLYHIRIENKGKHPVQLMTRYWHITDGKGMIQEVNGNGVIGLQPVILPDEFFDYTSSVNLTTPTGIMHGTYEFRNSDGTTFIGTIPVFSLDSDEAIRMAN